MFPSDAAWEKAFVKWSKLGERYREFEGKLGESATKLAEMLDFDNEFERLEERLAAYAYLKTTENVADGHYQDMIGRYRFRSSQVAQVASYFRPELMAIPDARMKKFLASPELAPHKLSLERILRYKPHTLSPEVKSCSPCSPR